MNEGLGKELKRKGTSVKRFRPFSESPDSMNFGIVQKVFSEKASATERMR